MKKYMLLLAGITQFSFAGTVTATDYQAYGFLKNSGYSYNAYGPHYRPKNCVFRFASFSGHRICLRGRPGGWHYPKSDHWHRGKHRWHHEYRYL